MFRDVNGTLLHTASFGAGPRTLVAMGGWIGSWELWLEPFEILSTSMRCIGIDHRGSGESSASAETITVEAMVADLMAVLDGDGVDRCLLAGESRGALICLMAATQYPDRFDGLILVDPAVDTSASGALGFSKALDADYEGTVDGFVRACVPSGDPHIVRWGRDILDRASPDAAIRLASAYADAAIDPSTIHTPVLVVHGELDVVVPMSDAQALAAALPDAELVTIPGAGHVPTMTHAAEVVAAIHERFGPLAR